MYLRIVCTLVRPYSRVGKPLWSAVRPACGFVYQNKNTSVKCQTKINKQTLCELDINYYALVII